MCSLRPPFDASSLHELAKKILKGKYAPLPKFYSDNMTALIDTLLNVDSRSRPNINQILKFPIIAEKIGKFLKEDIFKDEFSHTIIHNRRFFDAKGNFIKPAVMPIPKAKEEVIADPKQAEYKKYVNYIQNCIESKDDDYQESIEAE